MTTYFDCHMRDPREVLLTLAGAIRERYLAIGYSMNEFSPMNFSNLDDMCKDVSIRYETLMNVVGRFANPLLAEDFTISDYDCAFTRASLFSLIGDSELTSDTFSPRFDAKMMEQRLRAVSFLNLLRTTGGFSIGGNLHMDVLHREAYGYGDPVGEFDRAASYEKALSLMPDSFTPYASGNFSSWNTHHAIEYDFYIDTIYDNPYYGFNGLWCRLIQEKLTLSINRYSYIDYSARVKVYLKIQRNFGDYTFYIFDNAGTILSANKDWISVYDGIVNFSNSGGFSPPIFDPSLIMLPDSTIDDGSKRNVIKGFFIEQYGVVTDLSSGYYFNFSD